MKPSPQAVLDTVLGEVTNTTRDWGLDVQLASTTRLNSDLGFTSIDIIDLFATLEIAFQRKLPYESFITVEGGGYRSDIAIGELSEFIYEHYDTPRPGPAAV